MTQTGHYKMIDGKLTKVSDTAFIERPVYFNKGGVRVFDTSARRTFHSKTEKRQWLKTHGLREGGIINPDKAPE